MAWKNSVSPIPFGEYVDQFTSSTQSSPSTCHNSSFVNSSKTTSTTATICNSYYMETPSSLCVGVIPPFTIDSRVTIKSDVKVPWFEQDNSLKIYSVKSNWRIRHVNIIECSRCQTYLRRTVFMPCGHSMLCCKCALLLAEQYQRKYVKCPNCHMTISEINPMFLSYSHCNFF